MMLKHMQRGKLFPANLWRSTDCSSKIKTRLVRLLALCAVSGLSWVLYWYLTSIAPLPPTMKQNYLLGTLPRALHRGIREWWAPVDAGELGPPRFVEGLLAAPWPGSWPVPVPQIRLNASSDLGVGADIGPAWVAIYIFSTSTSASRARRALIRSHHPHLTLPPALQHLVEVKFILGGPRPPDAGAASGTEEEEDDIARESQEHGDIVRLQGLVRGDNMNEGKSWEFLRWAGSEGREAQWVL